MKIFGRSVDWMQDALSFLFCFLGNLFISLIGTVTVVLCMQSSIISPSDVLSLYVYFYTYTGEMGKVHAWMRGREVYHRFTQEE